MIRTNRFSAAMLGLVLVTAANVVVFWWLGRAAASGDTVAVIIDPRDARVFP